MTDLCDWEWRVLAGDLDQWGAAVGAALETLRARGLVDRRGCLTEKGFKALKDRSAQTEGAP